MKATYRVVVIAAVDLNRRLLSISPRLVGWAVSVYVNLAWSTTTIAVKLFLKPILLVSALLI